MQSSYYDTSSFERIDAEYLLSSSSSSSASISFGVSLDALNWTLEREICSDFACCGIALADMHALVEHFEDVHAFPLQQDMSADGYPYSDDDSSHALAHLDISSSSVSAPSPVDHTPFLSGSLSPLETPPCYSDLPSSASSSRLPSPLCLPTSTLNPNPPKKSFKKKQKKQPAPSSIPRRHERALAKRIKSLDSPRKREHNRKRTRDYVCTRPGCVKTYLNPNGLQYHLAKGTCEDAEGRALDAEDRTLQ